MESTSTSPSTSEFTPEEEILAKRMQEKMMGLDPNRIFCEKAPNNVKDLLKYTTDRLDQLLSVLVDLEFVKQPDWSMFDHVPHEDRRTHVAELCIEGLRAYDEHYGKRDRFDPWGRKRRPWVPPKK